MTLVQMGNCNMSASAVSPENFCFGLFRCGAAQLQAGTWVMTVLVNITAIIMNHPVFSDLLAINMHP